jgi:predicted nuclease of predicted toxin-antitoxin system
MAGLGISLYTDEMIYSRLAATLRMRGYDVVSCHEANRADQGSDDDQLAYAAMAGRAILTANARDFVPMDTRWKIAQQTHAGIIVFSGIYDFSRLLLRITTHLKRRPWKNSATRFYGFDSGR